MCAVLFQSQKNEKHFSILHGTVNVESRESSGRKLTMGKELDGHNSVADRYVGIFLFANGKIIIRGPPSLICSN